LNAADLTVAENEFHGLIGPNGSGKSNLDEVRGGCGNSHAWLGLFCRARHHARHSGGAGAGRHEPEIQITSVLPALTLYDNVSAGVAGADVLVQPVIFRERVAFCTIVSWPCSSNSGWRIMRMIPPPHYRTGNNNGSRLPWRWRPNPNCCCWMKPTGGMSLEERRVTGELFAADQETMLAGDRRAMISISFATSVTA